MAIEIPVTSPVYMRRSDLDALHWQVVAQIIEARFAAEAQSKAVQETSDRALRLARRAFRSAALSGVVSCIAFALELHSLWAH